MPVRSDGILCADNLAIKSDSKTKMYELIDIWIERLEQMKWEQSSVKYKDLQFRVCHI